jgi:hypothetical protein
LIMFCEFYYETMDVKSMKNAKLLILNINITYKLKHTKSNTYLLKTKYRLINYYI